MLFHLVSFVSSRLHREESGATAVEYGLMVAAIAAVIVLLVIALGDQLRDVFGFVTDEMQPLVPGDGG